MSVSSFDPADFVEGDPVASAAKIADITGLMPVVPQSLRGTGANWAEAAVLEVEQSFIAESFDDLVIGEQPVFGAERAQPAADISELSGAAALTDALTGEAIASNSAAISLTYPGYLLRYVPGQALENRPAVAQWQAQMQQRGWTVDVDGLYGPQSERIAREFQAEKGLAIDGIVGSQTWEAAFSVDERADTDITFGYSPFVPLSFDSQVQVFQQRLKALGWKIEADGLFGQRSAIATRNFQRQVGLDVDGIVGPQTLAAVFADSAPAAPVEQSFNSPAVSGRINTVGLNLIKDFEGLRLNSYRDAVGVWTIGYGHTRTAGPGQRITTAEATALLREDVATFENAVTQAVRVPITENQFAALVSFTYNVGSGALNSSTLLRRLNAGDTLGAADELLRWNRAGGNVLAGLTRRRVAERELFLS